MKSSLSSTCGHHEEDLDSLSFVQESLQERSAANDASSVHVNPLSNESLEVSDCSGEYSFTFPSSVSLGHIIDFWSSQKKLLLNLHVQASNVRKVF